MKQKQKDKTLNRRTQSREQIKKASHFSSNNYPLKK